MSKRLTTEEFIRRARAQHGDRYEYDEAVYRGGNQKIRVNCRLHGFFEQVATGHIQGQGCPKCNRGKPPTLTTEQFIEKAKAVHGDRYSYFKSKYVRSDKKIILICKIHGDFEQIPSVHLSGCGCRKCQYVGMSYTTEEFVAKAKAVHGDLYDYTDTKYAGKTTSLIAAVCKTHGRFSQRALSHLQGSGCQKCANERRGAARKKSLDAVLEAFKQTHGDRYDYSRVPQQYTGSNKKVEIFCRHHGSSFQQTPSSHAAGQGCPRCGNERRGLASRVTTKEFIERAQATHGDTYSYAMTTYTRSSEKVIVICKKGHGEFLQGPSEHLGGQGCPRCFGERVAAAKRSNTGEFIEKALKVHKGIYLYDNVDYRSCSEPIEIICKSCDSFWQTPTAHLQGNGCPHCKASHGEQLIANWLDTHGVAYIPEWRDHDCIAHTRTARFDFYLPDNNTIIEHDGQHHFHPLTYWFGHKQTPEEAEAALKKTQTADANKNLWAITHKYKMIRIRYDEDVPTILNTQLLPLL